MKRDIYQTYIGAKGVAFAWIGAALGPMFLLIGLEPGYHAHLVVGVASLVMVCVSLADGAKAYKANSWLGVLAYVAAPLLLLLAGGFFALAQGGS